MRRHYCRMQRCLWLLAALICNLGSYWPPPHMVNHFHPTRLGNRLGMPTMASYAFGVLPHGVPSRQSIHLYRGVQPQGLFGAESGQGLCDVWMQGAMAIAHLHDEMERYCNSNCTSLLLLCHPRQKRKKRRTSSNANRCCRRWRCCCPIFFWMFTLAFPD